MRAVALIATLILLAGCSSTPPRPLAEDPAVTWQERKERLANLQQWTLEGRLAIQSGHEGWHVSINWKQQQQDYSLMLIAPLGQGSLRLDGNNAVVTLQTDEGEAVSAADPGALLYQQFGWRIPVSALRYWVRGIPAPGPHQETIDEYGRLTQLHQGQWEIRFFDYEQNNGFELPGRVFVNNHQAKVKLVISNWQLPPTP